MPVRYCLSTESPSSPLPWLGWLSPLSAIATTRGASASAPYVKALYRESERSKRVGARCARRRADEVKQCMRGAARDTQDAYEMHEGERKANAAAMRAARGEAMYQLQKRERARVASRHTRDDARKSAHTEI